MYHNVFIHYIVKWHTGYDSSFLLQKTMLWLSLNIYPEAHAKELFTGMLWGIGQRVHISSNTIVNAKNIF